MTAGQAEQGRFSLLLREVLERFAAPRACRRVMSRALLLAERSAVPEDGPSWAAFVSGPFRDAATSVLGEPTATVLHDELASYFRHSQPTHDTLNPPRSTERPLPPPRDHSSDVYPTGSGFDSVSPQRPDETSQRPQARRDGPLRPARGSRMKRLKTLGYSEGGLVNQVGETRIMVVDDDPSYRRALARTLSEAGYDVSTAPDRRTALWMCDRLRPHLVLTDLELLDGGTGLDLAAAIKRTLGEAAPPVIVVTASAALPKATDEVRQVLPKMDNETLLEAISQCLAARE